MNFVSFTFVVFTLLTFAAYWSTSSRRVQNAVLVVASYAFYGWWDWRFCGLLALSSLVDYTVGLKLGGTNSRASQRTWLGVSLAANLGVLGYFKYAGFFLENLSAALSTLGWTLGSTELNVILPVGISFYTFQTLSYTIDVYRRRLEPTTALIDYLAYVSFFPQLVAGPIERGTRLLPQFLGQRQFSYSRAVDGCRQILVGAFKKMVLADGLAAIVDPAFADPQGSGGLVMALATVSFGLQIYFDFSAYSDIAIGTARLFGFELMRNFAYPYFSQSLTEFWRRWHISLSTWFRDYVFVPLGGSRVSPRRRALNILITFVVSGFWHGAAWTFLIWGAIHGLAMLPGALRHRGALQATEVPGGTGLVPSIHALGRMLATFVVVNIAWVWFRAASFGEAVLVFDVMLTKAANWDAVRAAIDVVWGAKRLLAFVAGFLAWEWVQRAHAHPLRPDAFPAPVRWLIYTLLFWAALTFKAQSTGPFIYFQF